MRESKPGQSSVLQTRVLPSALLLLGGILLVPGASGGQVGSLTTFINGTVADADQVNANFTAVADAVNDNDNRITTLEGDVLIRTVHVGPVPGDPVASGTALIDALSGIGGSSATNPYVLLIEPGLYDLGSQTLSMRPFVDIEGSGQDVTTITGTAQAASGVVRGFDDCELRNLTVENLGTPGGFTESSAVHIGAVTFRMTDVTCRTTNANGAAYCIDARTNSLEGYDLTVRDCTLIALGGGNLSACYSGFGSMNNGDASFEGCTLTATGATFNQAIRVQVQGMTQVRSSQVSGIEDWISFNVFSGTHTASVAGSLLDGLQSGGTGVVRRVNCHDENYVALPDLP